MPNRCSKRRPCWSKPRSKQPLQRRRRPRSFRRLFPWKWAKWGAVCFPAVRPWPAPAIPVPAKRPTTPSAGPGEAAPQAPFGKSHLQQIHGGLHYADKIMAGFRGKMDELLHSSDPVLEGKLESLATSKPRCGLRKAAAFHARG